MVEFAFIALFLVVLVVGIINFGLLLSFKQDVTRAAAEGARAGAVAIHSGAAPTDQTGDDRYQAAVAGLDEAVDGFGEECGVDGLTCTVTLHDCADGVTDADGYWQTPGPTFKDDCVTVELFYDYDAFPKFTEPPVLGGMLPDSIEATSVSRLND